MKRASALRYGVAVEGLQVKLDLIEAADVEIHAYGFFEVELGQAAAIQMVHDGEKCWCITFSTIIMGVLEELKGQEPYLARFSKHTSASGREYWTME